MKIFSASPAGLDPRKLRCGDSSSRVNCLGKLLHEEKRSHYIPPMSKLRRWMPSILCLLAVWLGVSQAVRMLSSGKPSAAATLALLDARPGAAEGAETRHAWIALISSRLAGLDLDSRHLVLMDSRLRSAFSEMSPEDQTHFLKATETPGLREFIEGSKRWSMSRYERLIAVAMAELEEQKPGSNARLLASLTRPAEEAIRKDGLEAFLKDTDPLTRFDTRPFIERLQKYSQMAR